MGKKKAISPIVSLSNKETRVLQYIDQHGSISSKEAVDHLGDGRLSETILQLRRKGFNIETVRVDSTNRYGEPCWYGRYILK